MKIGIVGSWYEMLPLMQILNQYDHEYHFWLDRAHRPWGDKSNELVNARIDEAVSYLIDKVWVDAIIVPPSAEHRLKKQEPSILPLFETYLLEYALKYSLVGKLWVLLESEQQAEQCEVAIKETIANYTLTDNQKNTKSFKQKFPLWTKSVRMWNYFLTTYGRRDPMVRKTLKYDLRYFSDADVDTLIPMSRWFLFYQKIIKTRINRKKKRFHWLDAVKASFELLADSRQLTADSYAVTLHCTDTPTALLEETKWMRVLSRGGEIEVKIESVWS